MAGRQPQIVLCHKCNALSPSKTISLFWISNCVWLDIIMELMRFCLSPFMVTEKKAVWCCCSVKLFMINRRTLKLSGEGQASVHCQETSQCGCCLPHSFNLHIPVVLKFLLAFLALRVYFIPPSLSLLSFLLWIQALRPSHHCCLPAQFQANITSSEILSMTTLAKEDPSLTISNSIPQCIFCITLDSECSFFLF